MSEAPSIASERNGESVRLALAGGWTVETSRAAERQAEDLIDAASGAKNATIDLAGVAHLDTAGAWLIDRAQAQLAAAGITTAYARARPEHTILLQEAHYRDFDLRRRGGSRIRFSKSSPTSVKASPRLGPILRPARAFSAGSSPRSRAQSSIRAACA